MRDLRSVLACLALVALPQLGCNDPDSGDPADPTDPVETTVPDDNPNGVIPPGGVIEQPFTSDVATLLDFDFDGELTSTSGSNVKGQVRAQLMYTVGHFNGEPGVARLDKLVLTNTSVLYIGGGLYRTRYHAHLPVAWGSKTNLPTSYTLTLPHRVDQTGQSSFMKAYGPTCNDGEPDSVTIGNYW